MGLLGELHREDSVVAALCIAAKAFEGEAKMTSSRERSLARSFR